MSSVAIGQVPPPFRLPAGQGGEIGLDDYRGKRHVIVWFTKGMACPFCRQHMSQLLRGYPSFQALNAEILQVTPSPPDRGRFYATNFKIPFPYLCDPDYRARRAWGLEVRSHSIVWYARAFYKGFTAPAPETDFGKLQPALGEFPRLLTDEDMGFFILDRKGVLRYALSGAYAGPGGARQIPANEEIVRELRRCEEAPAG